MENFPPGQKVKRARLVKGLRQLEVDSLVGVGKNRTSSYEKGEAIPSNEYLQALEKHWGYPVSWYLDGEDTWPLGETNKPKRVPLLGFVPNVIRHTDPAARTIPIFPTEPIPANATARIIADNRYAPYLIKGDEIVVAPLDSPINALYLASNDGSDEILSMEVVDGEMRLLTLQGAHSQAKPIGAIFYIRRVNGPLKVIFQSETAITKEMLSA